MGSVGVGVQMSELARLDAATLEQTVEVLAADPHRKPQRRQLPLLNQSVDGVRREVEKAGHRRDIEPVVLLVHRVEGYRQSAGQNGG